MNLFGWMSATAPRSWLALYRFYTSSGSSEQLDAIAKIPNLTKLPKDSTPEISIILSLYQSDFYLRRLLFELSHQTAAHKAEFLIASIEPSAFQRELLHEFSQFTGLRVTVIEYPSRVGLYEAWNKLADLSQADILCNWNDDDPHSLYFIERMLYWTSTMHYFDVWFSDFYISYTPLANYSDCQRVGSLSLLKSVNYWSLLYDKATPHASCCWRKSMHLTLGGFDESLEIASDRDFWIRAAGLGALFYYIREPLYAYYVNPQGLSTSGRPAELEWEYVQHRYLKAIEPRSNIFAEFRELFQGRF